MNQPIVVQTPFTDAAEFIRGFRDHIDEQHLLLSTYDPIPEGEWVQFHVCLADNSPIFEGIGRCAGVMDTGEEASETVLYQLLLDSLQLEGASQILYEEILQARQLGDDSQYAEADNAEAVEVGAGEVLEIDEHHEPRVLSRPPVMNEWEPDVVSAPHSTPPPSGLFDYPQGLTFPAVPPRPEPGTFKVIQPAAAPVDQSASAVEDDDEAERMAAAADEILGNELSSEEPPSDSLAPAQAADGSEQSPLELDAAEDAGAGEEYTEY